MRYLIILMFLTGCASTPSRFIDGYEPKFKPHLCYMSNGTKFSIVDIGFKRGYATYNIYIQGSHGVKRFYFAFAKKFDEINFSTSKQVKCE